MSERIKLLIDDAVTRLEVAKYTYVITDLEISGSPFPQRVKPDAITEKPRLSIAPAAFDRDNITRARNSVREELWLQVGLVQKLLVEPEQGGLDSQHGWNLIRLSRQVAKTMQAVNSGGYGWTRTLAVRDPQNLPYMFNAFREDGTFWAIFNSIYTGVG